MKVDIQVQMPFKLEETVYLLIGNEIISGTISRMYIQNFDLSSGELEADKISCVIVNTTPLDPNENWSSIGTNLSKVFKTPKALTDSLIPTGTNQKGE